jgi:ABC-type nitrate/sulfonate/bicarbonate transport system ATPase subunit
MLSRLLEKGRGAGAAQTLETFMRVSGAAPLLQKSGLSGGERARVALLWALASDCRTVLLDEPFASVALADREPLLKAYLKTAESLGKWTIIVSHDVLSPEVECIFNVAKL